MRGGRRTHTRVYTHKYSHGISLMCHLCSRTIPDTSLSKTSTSARRVWGMIPLRRHQQTATSTTRLRTFVVVQARVQARKGTAGAVVALVVRRDGFGKKEQRRHGDSTHFFVYLQTTLLRWLQQELLTV